MAGMSIPGESCTPCTVPNNMGCPIRLSDLCVYYAGPNISTSYTVSTGDTVESILIKLLNGAPSFTVVTSALTTLTLLRTVGGYIFTGSSISTWTLPFISQTTNKLFIIKNRGSALLTMNCSGTDNIYLTSPVSSLIINPGDSLTFINDGTYWEVV